MVGNRDATRTLAFINKGAADLNKKRNKAATKTLKDINKSASKVTTGKK